MAEDLTPDLGATLREGPTSVAPSELAALTDVLRSREAVRLAPFATMRRLAQLVNALGDDPVVHALVLRACEWRDELGDSATVLDAIVRERGLFPYLRPEWLGLADRFAYAVHRPLEFADEVVFHRVQARVYHLLLEGENVVLSAPTSFGKSLIIDAMIATGRFKNVVVVVPTIALIDETRRRLFARFGSLYRIITHVGQQRGSRNLFLLTQERVVEFSNLGRVDFLAVDEFYKLDPRMEPERSGTLNEALYRLLRDKPQFYLLGPNIEQIPQAFQRRYGCRFIRTDYATVVTEIERIASTQATREQELAALCRRLGGQPTLIYTRSPRSARNVAALLVDEGLGEPRPELAAAVEWASAHYHPRWGFVRALAHGIGVHHGKLPRALSQYAVRAFEEAKINILICTSTLMEGVNTKAKNVVVYDNKVADQKLDFFDYSNIRGRSGRMGRHFVGRVYLFSAEPAEQYPDVDIPLVTQTSDAPDSLLIQLDEADLSDDARRRVQRYKEHPLLDLALLRANRGIDPADQLRLAEHIRDEADTYYARLGWRALPTTLQLQSVCGLIWDYLRPKTAQAHGAKSAKQLARKIGRLRVNSDVHRIIQEELAGQRGDPDADAAVEETLDFLRHWASYHFPRYLMALHRIQAVVLPRVGFPPGNYTAFASQVENLFAPAGIVALDEYGVPLQVGLKIRDALADAPDLDAALSQLRALDVHRLNLDTFEQELVIEAQRFV